MERKKILKLIENTGLIEKNDKIVIGISGGPDSVALFYLLEELKVKYNLSLYLAHINHLIRGKSANEDEEFVQKLGLKYSIPVYVKQKDVIKYSKDLKIGVEEAGRNVRYDFFEEVKEKLGANKVALAHNLDDNVETFLFRMMRGTSLAGLSAIPEKRDFYIRPILSISKENILKYLGKGKINFRIDESNNTTDYTRNRIRLDLIPKIEKEFNPKFKEKIINLISEIGKVNNVLDQNIKEYKNKKILEINEFKEKSDYIQKRILNQYLNQYDIEITAKKINEILSIIKSNGSLQLDLGNKYIIKKDYKIIKIIKKEAQKIEKIEKEQEFFLNEEIQFGKYRIIAKLVNEVKKDKNCYYLDYDKLFNGNLIVRARKNGDKFIPLGMKGTKKIKKYFIDKKINKEKRDTIPIITDVKKVVLILGMRGSEEVKITKRTKKILKISFEEDN